MSVMVAVLRRRGNEYNSPERRERRVKIKTGGTSKSWGAKGILRPGIGDQ